jgi:hypothetical protein
MKNKRDLMLLDSDAMMCDEAAGEDSLYSEVEEGEVTNLLQEGPVSWTPLSGTHVLVAQTYESMLMVVCWC